MVGYMTITRRAVLKAITATSALAAASRLGSPAMAQAKPCKLGILAPRTGIAASPGISGLRATEWAVERFNAQGGIAGRKIELVVEEETSPKDTIERFQKLVQQDKVDCVQGIISTGVALALGPVVEEARALTIFWDGTTQDGVVEKLPNPKFLFSSTDNECEAVMSSLLAIKHWKGQFKRIAGINPDYSYGRNNMAAFVALLKRFNIEHEVVTEQWPKVGTMELTSNVAALKAAKPDLIFSSLLFADLPVFMKQASAAELTKDVKLVFPGGRLPAHADEEGLHARGHVVRPQHALLRQSQRLADGQGIRCLVRRQAQGLSELGSRSRLFRHRLLQGAVERAAKAKGTANGPAPLTWSPPWKAASPSKVSAARGPGARITSPTRLLCRASPVTRTATTSSRSTTPRIETMYSADLQKPAGADFWEWLKTAQFKV